MAVQDKNQNMNIYQCYFDGSCNPNPGGKLGFGSYIIRNDTEQIHTVSESVYPATNNTNNVAEYLGLISILDYFINNDIQNSEIHIFGDSSLCIKQMLQKYNISNDKPYSKFAHEALNKVREIRKINTVYLTWIPREDNGVADQLSTGSKTIKTLQEIRAKVTNPNIPTVKNGICANILLEETKIKHLKDVIENNTDDLKVLKYLDIKLEHYLNKIKSYREELENSLK